MAGSKQWIARWMLSRNLPEYHDLAAREVFRPFVLQTEQAYPRTVVTDLCENSLINVFYGGASDT